MEPSPEARRWPVRQARVAGSQPGRMIQENPGQVELLGDVLRQCFDSDRLRRVMAGVENIDAQLLGVEEGPVLSFSSHKRIEPRRGSLWDQRPSGAGHDSNPVHALGAEREESRGGAERLGQRPVQVLPLTTEFAPDPGRGSVIRSEVAAHLYPQHAGQHRIVADVGVTIERKVGGVQRDVCFDQSSEPAVSGTDERPETTPKHSVMHEETIGMLFSSLADRCLAEVHGGSQSVDVAGVADLEAVQRLRKSTRLNSSHPSISYAVFCLKKKKNI